MVLCVDTLHGCGVTSACIFRGFDYFAFHLFLEPYLIIAKTLLDFAIPNTVVLFAFCGIVLSGR